MQASRFEGASAPPNTYLSMAMYYTYITLLHELNSIWYLLCLGGVIITSNDLINARKFVFWDFLI